SLLVDRSPLTVGEPEPKSVNGQRSTVHGQRKAPFATNEGAPFPTTVRRYDSRALPRRRAFLLGVAGALVLLLALAPIASADWLTPESGGSPNANDIDTLYKIVLAIGAVIFVLVEGLLIFSVVRFRRRRGGP